MFFYFKIMRSIVYQNLSLFFKVFLGKLIDISLWALISLFVTTYILPKMGLIDNYGLVQFAGILATVGMFEAYSAVYPFIADLDGKQMIYHELGFPIPSICLFVSKLIAKAISFILLTLCMIPISKCLLWNIIFLENFNWFYLTVIIVSANIFFASMSFIIIGFIKNMTKMDHVWYRFIFPIWFMGGFQFSWKYLYQTNQFIAYLDLFNPIIYINEAFKIAILKEPGLCSFWLCILIIFLFSLFCFYLGYIRLKKRLDFI